MCLWILAVLAGVHGQSTVLPKGALTTVRQVRSLEPEQAGLSVPVHLTGIVTVPSTYKTSFFFMDNTAGISVDRADGGEAMQPGERVEIDGESGPGMFAPVVVVRHIKLLGKAPLPAAREVNADAMRGGRLDSQWISLRAKIRSVAIQNVWGHPVLVLKADIGASQFVSVQVRDYAKGGWDQLPGAVVRLRGVCGSAFNDRRQLVGLRMLLSSLDDIAVLKPANPHPFDLPSRALDGLFQFNNASDLSDAVKVTGTVTQTVSGVYFFVQDGAKALSVRTAQKTPLSAGERVEVVGYPANGDYAPILEDAIYRVVPGGGSVVPVRMKAAEAIVQSERGFWIAPYDAQMVEMDAQVAAQAYDVGRDQIFLRDGGVTFRARLSNSGGSLPVLEPGTQVRVRGSCVTRIEEERGVHTFYLLLNSPGDISVVRAAPWWGRRQSGWMVAIALGLLMIAGAILALLKHLSELHILATKDSLTKAYNRGAFLRLAGKAWRKALREGSTAMLLYVDVDRFKEINDTYGHEAGDLALCCLVEALQKSFRREDIVGRLGGDEFAVFCTAPKSQFVSMKTRLESTLKAVDLSHGLTIQLELSTGALECDASKAGCTIEDLVTGADSLMYRIKRDRQGRGLVLPSPVTNPD